MGRGVSSGGGQSSLGYLFGSPDEGGKPASAAAQGKGPQNLPPAGISRAAPPAEQRPPAGVPTEHDTSKPLEVGTGASLGRTSNNYHRADGQNTGNFITDRPSTKVHAAPGGGSSLGYLFGGN
eukprot:TRINITY_DN7754_c3_g1_i1.p1 TRINITY_DN7754_c3_g1~~TRINITY_DN7754_c3_g1_i1.p1  ORF type:complete len:123 (+),score=17.69 TRINITY_DN7754_c3_g1_i1:125-493(+)